MPVICVSRPVKKCYKNVTVPGFKGHVKDLHTIARHEFVLWKNAGTSRSVEILFTMNQSRFKFKSALKYCQRNKSRMRADALAKSMMDNDMVVFWKEVQKSVNSKVFLATKIDRSVGDANITEM